MTNLSKNNLNTVLNQNDFTSLTDIDFIEKEIISLEDQVFEELKNATKLNLNFNRISSINSKSFYGLTSLTELYLKGQYLFFMFSNF